MTRYFVFDVESIGLHGEAFAVGGGVYLENGAAQWEFRFATDAASCSGTVEDRKWVNEHVPVIEITHRSARQMRDAFWDQWLKAKAEGALMAVECGWPVEARFLAQCIDDDAEARKWSGPYPLHEIASYLAASGRDPMATYERLPSENPAHDPLADARQSARLLAESLERLKSRRDASTATVTLPT